ncbi:acyltransferase domain-containing protein [Pendulispora rubella]|uniref:Acyltransferase domain-containing protein n=1 Tax=Pendulispora rubella TaxID=2741070 RepID=A0ABZ2LAV6_9BACT
MTGQRDFTVESAKEWLVAELSVRLRIPPASIDPNEPFHRYGLDSAGALAMAGTLSSLLKRSIVPMVFWSHPNITALAAYLANGTDVQTPKWQSAEVESNDFEPLAIVGMACRFPGADGLDALRTLLKDGIDAVREIPAHRWHSQPSGPDEQLPPRAGLLENVDGFDPLAFGISPREALEIDPQQRLALELAAEAFDDAGLSSDSLRQSRVGVFIGAIWRDYGELASLDTRRVTPHSAVGQSLNMIANRVSFAFGLTGPSLVVDTACSSSLMAVHLACQSLIHGETAVALAGGINLILALRTMVALQRFGGLAPDGRCKAFDAAANGFGRGEGGGLVVLKRLSKAMADGDRIYCIVRGSASNNDGPSNGLTAPNPRAQQDVLLDACRRGGVDPARVGYVEAHGTGTALGDPIEAGALGAVFGQVRPEGSPLRIGSIKTNIGHLEGAAGIAGLIKAVLSVNARTVYPSLHFHEPNPLIAFEDLHLEVPRTVQRWPDEAHAALAGVSAFGWGGTNVHVLVEEVPPPETVRVPYLAPRAPAFAGGENKRDSGIRSKPRIVFVCAPQGGQWVGMGRAMLASEPVFRAALERIDRHLVKRVGWSVRTELLRASPSAGDARFDDVSVIQPVLFAIQVALSEWWRAAGVEPDAVIGHSLGEIAAAYIAGALSLEDAVETVCHYSRLQKTTAADTGMALVDLDADAVEEWLGAYGGRIVIGAYNGPSSTVVSGEASALSRLVTELKLLGIRASLVRVAVAAHSAAMDPIAPEIARVLSGIRPKTPAVPMMSTLHARFVEGAELDGAYFAANLRQPVRFCQGIDALLREGHDVFLEMSLAPVLQHALEQCRSGWGDAEVLPGIRREMDERSVLYEARARIASRCLPAERPAPVHVLPVSAKSPDALRTFAERMARSLEEHPDRGLEDICHTAGARRTHHPVRWAAVGGTREELATALRAACDEVEGYGASRRPKVAFVFPGQGAQWLGMGRELFAQERAFREAMLACDRAVQGIVGWSIVDELHASEDVSNLGRLDVVQPLLFSIEVALAAQWTAWGIAPDAVIGHSMGEVAAAHVAGALSLEDAARIICLRSRLMRTLSGLGAMMATELTVEEAKELLRGREDVSIAVSNSRRSTVLSGHPPTLERIGQELTGRDIFWRWVKVDIASHSPQMDPLRDDILAAVAPIRPHEARIAMHSTVVNARVAGAELTGEYWVKNLRDPVFFGDAVRAAVADGITVFVELSPHPILVPAIEQGLTELEASALVVPSLRRHESEKRTLFGSLARIYAAGHDPDWDAVHGGGKVVSLPSYPWQRASYWLPAPVASALPREGHPLTGTHIESALEPGTHYWQTQLDCESIPYLRDHVIDGDMVAPGSVFAEMALAAAAVATGSEGMLYDLRFDRALPIPAEGGRRVQVALKQFDGAASLHILSRGEGGNPSWTVHARAMVRARTGSPAACPTLDELRARTSGRMHVRPDVYAWMNTKGLAYGARLRGIQHVSIGAREALARIAFEEAPLEHVDRYMAHPALVDAAFQVMLSAVPPEALGEQSCITVGMDTFQIHARPGASGYAYARCLHCDGGAVRADVFLFDDRGNLTMNATGLHLRLLPTRTAILRAEEAPPQSVRSQGVHEGVRAMLDTLAPAKRRRAVENEVRDSAALVVRIPSAKMPLDAPLRTLGLDSVMSLELRNRLERKFDVRLSATAIWNHPTIVDLASFLIKEMKLATDSVPDEVTKPPPSVRKAAADLPPESKDARHHLARELALVADLLKEAI